jgi:hypothetical protein
MTTQLSREPECFAENLVFRLLLDHKINSARVGEIQWQHPIAIFNLFENFNWNHNWPRSLHNASNSRMLISKERARSGIWVVRYFDGTGSKDRTVQRLTGMNKPNLSKNYENVRVRLWVMVDERRDRYSKYIRSETTDLFGLFRFFTRRATFIW